jgi:hypothetical protein
VQDIKILDVSIQDPCVTKLVFYAIFSSELKDYAIGDEAVSYDLNFREQVSDFFEVDNTCGVHSLVSFN